MTDEKTTRGVPTTAEKLDNIELPSKQSDVRAYSVPISKFRRHKLSSIDAATVLLSLIAFKGVHKDMEIARKNLVKKMHGGDFFMVMYTQERKKKRCGSTTIVQKEKL